ncbi:MAG: hypothetical protein ABI557_21475, partial [Aureliella sp.]
SLNKPSLAEQILVQAVEQDKNGQAALFFAKFLLEQRRFSEAAQLAEKAVEQSNEIEAYLVHIVALQRSGKPHLALDVWTRARQLAPNDPRLADIQF